MRRPVIWLALACLLMSTSVSADVADDARYFDRQARIAFDRGRMVDALELFLLANQASRTPSTLYSVAATAGVAGESEIAFIYMSEYLASAPEGDPHLDDARAQLERLRSRLALVTMQVEPSGASVYVDRPALGRVARGPATIPVSPGEHTVIIEADGYHGARRTIHAARGAEVEVEVALTVRSGTIRVDSEPAGATVDIAGERIGETNQDVVLPIGAHDLVVRAEGHEPWARRVEVREGATTRVTATLLRIPPATGRLLVRADGVRATVSLDGHDVGETPLALADVDVGVHRVTVRAPGRRSWSREVRVDENRSEYLNVTLVPR